MMDIPDAPWIREAESTGYCSSGWWNYYNPAIDIEADDFEDEDPEEDEEEDEEDADSEQDEQE